MASKPGRYGIESTVSRASLHPGYWKTLARLRRNNTKLAADGASLHFTDYPFEPSSVFPSGTLSIDQIAEINLGCPCEVRLTSGEILFVTHDNKEALVTFINRNDVQTRWRSSICSALLDPFRDTWEDQETIDKQFDWFASLGLTRQIVDSWRREVAVAMVAYNFGTHLWEWASLDLYDVLLAQQARLTRSEFADFYTRAMQLAQRDPAPEISTPVAGSNIGSTLFTVLLDWYPHDKGRAKDFSKLSEQRSAHIEQRKQALCTDLSAAYSAPHRYYHTRVNIESCLTELTQVWQYAIHLNEVRWALLFHDAIYDPRRQDNEARSADWACSVMDELRRPEDEKSRVREMILATQHAKDPPHTSDEALLLDIDLSILGADVSTFDEYDRSIRAEYDWVPEQTYRQARSQVLESFLKRDQLYNTAYYRRRCEGSARANLQRALARLQVC